MSLNFGPIISPSSSQLLEMALQKAFYFPFHVYMSVNGKMCVLARKKWSHYQDALWSRAHPFVKPFHTGFCLLFLVLLMWSRTQKWLCHSLVVREIFFITWRPDFLLSIPQNILLSVSISKLKSRERKAGCTEKQGYYTFIAILWLRFTTWLFRL